MNIISVVLSCLLALSVYSTAPAQSVQETKTPQANTPASAVQEAASLDISDVGRVCVLNDGMVVAQWGDFLNPDTDEADEVVPYFTIGVKTGQMDLVKAGSEWSLHTRDAALPGTALTSGVNLRIPLVQKPADADGCERYAIFQMTGILTLEPAREGAGCLLWITDLSGDERFSLRLSRKSVTAVPSSGPGGAKGGNRCGCVADCKHGYCAVTDCNGICSCWCGLFGEPWCVCIPKLFLMHKTLTQ